MNPELEGFEPLGKPVPMNSPTVAKKVDEILAAGHFALVTSMDFDQCQIWQRVESANPKVEPDPE